MRILIAFCVINILILSSVTEASTKPTTNESILTPGARLLAGDPNKNEFFIIAENDTPYIKTILNEKDVEPKVQHQTAIPSANTVSSSVAKRTANKESINKIEMALRKAMQMANSQKFVPKIKTLEVHYLGGNQAIGRRIKITTNQAKVAIQKIKINTDKAMLHVKVTAKRIQHKMSSKKSVARIKLVSHHIVRHTFHHKVIALLKTVSKRELRKFAYKKKIPAIKVAASKPHRKVKATTATVAI